MKPEPIKATDEPREPPDGCEFSVWLWRQQHRKDQIGQLAHVIARDPFWTGGSRERVVEHLKNLGANQQTQKLLHTAYNEFQRAGAHQRRQRERRAKRAAARDARRRNR